MAAGHRWYIWYQIMMLGNSEAHVCEQGRYLAVE